MIEDFPNHGRINWALVLLFIALMFAMLFYFDRAVAADSDQAHQIAEKTIQSMGGMDQWKQVGAIRFNFEVDQGGGAPPHAAKHLWDHRNGRDHVEGTKDGKTMVAWVDLNKKTGAAWLDGKKLEGDDLKKAMDWAYGRWVNDTYWMIMPLKMLDSGVNMKYEGEKNGHDVLHLSFGKVGLTPGDQYWAYINKTTGLMDRWQYQLEGGEKGDWNWEDWTTMGNLKLSKTKVQADKKVAIRFNPLEVLDSADPSYFGQTEKRL